MNVEVIISKEKMEEIYETLKTPYKVGAVVKTDGYLNDSPVVFKQNGKYYMTYVSIDEKCEKGYRTFIAESENLLDWKRIGCVLMDGGEWAMKQAGGYAQLQDIRFGGTNELGKIDGKYLMGIVGGNHFGYEADPLSMGLAYADDLLDAKTYEKSSSPILSGTDVDARHGETLTIFKPHCFYDEAKTLGYPYVCVYNAKNETNRESIFLAVSEDGYSWKRYGDEAIISVFHCADSVVINGDPQIIKMGDVYVMAYFIYDKIQGAYNTFAVSKDLLHWQKWEGDPLVKSEYPWENKYAHKQWIIKENGVVYHFYCAVTDKDERFIALATSEKLY